MTLGSRGGGNAKVGFVVRKEGFTWADSKVCCEERGLVQGG